LSQEQKPIQLSSEQAVQWLHDKLSLIDTNSHDERMEIIRNYEKMILTNAKTSASSITEIKRLQELCTKHKIDFKPPKPKKLNRQQRRKADRDKKKAEKKASKTAPEPEPEPVKKNPKKKK